MKPVRLPLSIAVALLAPVASAQAQTAPDPVKGKQVFARCAVCHNVDAKPGKLGPSLAGVINRRAASVAGFRYSPAMKSSKLTWTPPNIDKYLAAPRTVVPGTTMMSPPVVAAGDRANIIAYLKTVSKAKPAPATKR